MVNAARVSTRKGRGLELERMIHELELRVEARLAELEVRVEQAEALARAAHKLPLEFARRQAAATIAFITSTRPERRHELPIASRPAGTTARPKTGKNAR